VSTKPPTPQGISALLRKAGFQRGETFKKGGRRGEVSVAGYHVSLTARHETVDVRWWAPTHDTSRQDKMLAAYAEVIEGAGWAVETRRAWLIVTAPKQAG